MLTNTVFDTHGGILDEAPNFPYTTHTFLRYGTFFFFVCPGQVFLNKLHHTSRKAYLLTLIVVPSQSGLSCLSRVTLKPTHLAA
jgi:hypothetical protein